MIGLDGLTLMVGLAVIGFGLWLLFGHCHDWEEIDRVHPPGNGLDLVHYRCRDEDCGDHFWGEEI